MLLVRKQAQCNISKRKKKVQKRKEEKSWENVRDQDINLNHLAFSKEHWAYMD